MLLSLSGLSQDAQVSFDVVVGTGDGDGGVPRGQLLARLVEAMWEGDPSTLAAIRDEVTETMGGDALVDAVAVSANFHMMTRIADGTGTPIERGGLDLTAEDRAQIGVDDMVSRRQIYPDNTDLNVRRFGAPMGEPIVLVAGFADHGGMFELLGSTELGRRFALHAVDLPGMGGSSPLDEPLTLDRAAAVVADVVNRTAARTIVGHSVGSIVASLAADAPDSSIDTVISIEGNLTPADAYFSGSAAQFESPDEFHAAFLARLSEMAADDEVVRRYRDQAAIADSTSIWEMGSDTHHFSRKQSPGEVLARSAEHVHYLYNPDKTPDDSIQWLREHELAATILEGTTHWPTVDQPNLIANTILDCLGIAD
jgi:pimeloyl-ACP methyl ester carboxylesterase